MRVEFDRLPWFLDETTGFPLPLMPLKDAPVVMNRDGTPYHTDPDTHHFFSPRKLFNADQIGPGGKVVRITRLQQIRRFHHTAAHKQMEPPPVIESPTEQFRLSLLALSGYIPTTAIDVRDDGPTLVDLSPSLYQDLRESTMQGFEKSHHVAIGRFFLQAITDTSVHTLCDDIREEFLQTKHETRKSELGNFILKSLSHRAVEPVNSLYSEAKKAGEIPPNQQSPFRTAVAYARRGKPRQFFEQVLDVA